MKKAMNNYKQGFKKMKDQFMLEKKRKNMMKKCMKKQMKMFKKQAKKQMK